jgi:hypothetical protein
MERTNLQPQLRDGCHPPVTRSAAAASAHPAGVTRSTRSTRGEPFADSFDGHRPTRERPRGTQLCTWNVCLHPSPRGWNTHSRQRAPACCQHKSCLARSAEELLNMVPFPYSGCTTCECHLVPSDHTPSELPRSSRKHSLSPSTGGTRKRRAVARTILPADEGDRRTRDPRGRRCRSKPTPATFSAFICLTRIRLQMRMPTKGVFTSRHLGSDAGPVLSS